MPYDNEYNKKLAREVDYANRKYIAHCSSTGQGTPDYRANVPGLSGSGSGGEATFSGAGDCGSGGDGILGFQTGSLLGGPKVKEISHRALSTFSSLGAPLSQVFDRAPIVNPPKPLASGTSSVGLPQAGAPAGAPASTPATEATAPDVGQGGDGVPGIKPYKGVPGLFKNTRFSSLNSGPVPASGKMFVAGKYASVRDLGDFGSSSGAGACCESCQCGDSCEGSEEESEVVVQVGKGGNLERSSIGQASGDCSGSGKQKKNNDGLNPKEEAIVKQLEKNPIDNLVDKTTHSGFKKQMIEAVKNKSPEELKKLAEMSKKALTNVKDMIPDKDEKKVEKAIDDSVGEGGGYKLYELGRRQSPSLEEINKSGEYRDSIKDLSKEELKKLTVDNGLSFIFEDGKPMSKSLLINNLCNWHDKENWVISFDNHGPVKEYYEQNIENKPKILNKDIGEGGKGPKSKRPPKKPKEPKQPKQPDATPPAPSAGKPPKGAPPASAPPAGAPPAGKPPKGPKGPDVPSLPKKQRAKRTPTGPKAPPAPPGKPPAGAPPAGAPPAGAPPAPPGKPPAGAPPAGAPPAPPAGKPPKQSKPKEQKPPKDTTKPPAGAPPAGAKPPPPGKPGAPAPPPPAAAVPGQPSWLKNTKKVLDVAQQVIQTVMLGKQAYDMFSKKPVDDFADEFGDEYGDVEGLTPEELIEMLQSPPNNLSPEEIQQLLKESQGAVKVETGATSGPSASIKVQAKALAEGIKGKQKPPKILKEGEKPCMEPMNAVADFSEGIAKEALPVRKMPNYFGMGGVDASKLQSNPNITEAIPATVGEQTKVVPKAQMQASTMSGLGKVDPSKLQSNPNINEAVPATKGEQTKVVPKAQMQASTMSGMGKAKKPNKRAEIVKKIMKEKGLKMIEASKYVKENNLY